MLLFCFFCRRFLFLLRSSLCGRCFRCRVSAVLLAEIVHPLDLDLQVEGTALITIKPFACAVKQSSASLVLPVLEELRFKKLLGMIQLVYIRGILYPTHSFELLVDWAVAEFEAAREVHRLVRLFIRLLFVEVALVNLQGENADGVSQVVLQAIIHKRQGATPLLLAQVFTQAVQLVLHHRKSSSEPAVHANLGLDRKQGVLRKGKVNH